MPWEWEPLFFGDRLVGRVTRPDREMERGRIWGALVERSAILTASRRRERSTVAPEKPRIRVQAGRSTE